MLSFGGFRFQRLSLVGLYIAGANLLSLSVSFFGPVRLDGDGPEHTE